MPLRTTKTLIAPMMLPRSMAYPKGPNQWVSMRHRPDLDRPKPTNEPEVPPETPPVTP